MTLELALRLAAAVIVMFSLKLLVVKFLLGPPKDKS